MIIKKFIIAMAVVVLTFCYLYVNLNPTMELLRISKSGNLNIATISNNTLVSEIKKSISNIEYTGKHFDVDLNNPTYTVWIENNESPNRISQTLLWMDNDLNKVIAFNPETSEFGYVQNINSAKLEKIISSAK